MAEYRRKPVEIETLTKEFHLGDVLSVTTSRLVSPRHMDGVYAVLNFMTGDNLFTHALPRARDEMAPVIFDQHPQLMVVDTSGVTTENWRGWLDEQVAKFGEKVTLTAAPAEHLALNPLDEPILDGKDAVVVGLGGGESQ